jgi:peptide/nickel transport system permease protein
VIDAVRSDRPAQEGPARAGLQVDVDELLDREPLGFYQAAWRRFRRDRAGMVALAGFLLICLLALAAPLISDGLLGTDPNRQRLEERFAPPGGQYLLGSDEFGRDQLTRLLHGARVSIALGFLVAAIGLSIGTVIGLWAGFYGGWVDDLVYATIQVKRAIPFLYLMIVVGMFWTPSLTSLAIIFGLWSWSGIAWLIRGQALAGRQREYVVAARALGAPDRRVIFRHVLPNVGSVILIVAGFDVAGTILGEAAISFLGFGIQPPTPSWGNMLSNSLEYVRRGWWLVAAPGAAISMTVLCVYLVADALRDALDPRL